MIKAVLNLKKNKQKIFSVRLDLWVKAEYLQFGGGQNMWPQREEASVQSWKG